MSVGIHVHFIHESSELFSEPDEYEFYLIGKCHNSVRGTCLKYVLIDKPNKYIPFAIYIEDKAYRWSARAIMTHSRCALLIIDDVHIPSIPTRAIISEKVNERETFPIVWMDVWLFRLHSCEKKGSKTDGIWWTTNYRRNETIECTEDNWRISLPWSSVDFFFLSTATC